MKFAEGSALITLGDTRVLTTASVERRVPKFLEETPRGWLTAEYSMLPRATHTRSQREVTRGRPSGRSAEIQRLIGRSLRAVIDLEAIPGLHRDRRLRRAAGRRRHPHRVDHRRLRRAGAGVGAAAARRRHRALAADRHAGGGVGRHRRRRAAARPRLRRGQPRAGGPEPGGHRRGSRGRGPGHRRGPQLLAPGARRAWSISASPASARWSPSRTRCSPPFAATSTGVERRGRRRQASPKSEAELWGKPP